MRYEDTNESEFIPASDFGVTKDGETSWFLEDRQQAIAIIQHSDGMWSAAIQDFTDNDE